MKFVTVRSMFLDLVAISRPRLHRTGYTIIAAACILVAGVRAADAQYVCLPTCATTDGRFIAVPGGPLADALTPSQLTVKLSVPSFGTTVEVGIFDGDTGGLDGQGKAHWDRGSTPSLYELYTDPDGDGVGNALLQTLSGGAMPDHGWFTIGAPTSAAAQALPGGPFTYVLLIRNDDPLSQSWNALKVRTVSSTSLRIPPQPLSFIAPVTGMPDAELIYPAFPSLASTTYDGGWDFFLDVPAGQKFVAVWDGDLDYGPSDCAVRDTDDIDTPNAVPSFAVGTAAVAEGVAQVSAAVAACSPGVRPTGDPPDTDLRPGSEFYRRDPAIEYFLLDQVGNIYRNFEPSGNHEWERFVISAALCDRLTTDYCAPFIPSGPWRVNVRGMDAGNITAFLFPFDIVPAARRVRAQTVTAAASHPARTFTVTVAPEAAVSAVTSTLTADASHSSVETLTLASVPYTLTQTPVPTGWDVVGALVKPDQAGTEVCSPGDSFVSGPQAQVPSDIDSYLVCFLHEFVGLPTERRLRIQVISSSGSRPAEVFWGPIQPGGPDTGAWAVFLPTSGASDVANRIVSTAAQTIEQAALPLGWTSAGFIVKPDPGDSATCSVNDTFAGTQATLPEDVDNYLVCVLNEYGASPTDRIVRFQKVTATSSHPAEAFAGSIAPGGPSPASFSLTLAGNAAVSPAESRSLTPSAHVITEGPLAMGWSLVGFAVKPDPGGSATCTPADAYAGTSATVPADGNRYLVCILNDYAAPPTTRVVRIQKVTGTATHPSAVFAGPISPGGPDTAAWAVGLDVNASSSDVAHRVLTTAAQTINESAPAAGWAIVGFLVKPDPNGTATCAPQDTYSGTQATVPADDQAYMVCARNDYTPPTSDRIVRVQKLTPAATHPAETFSLTIAPAGPGSGALSLSVSLDAASSAVAQRTLSPQTHVVTEAAPPAGWTLAGFVVKPDPSGTATCGIGDGYAGTSATIPADSQRHLVCVRNDYAAPSTTRVVRIRKLTGSATHPSAVFFGPIVPGGPDTGAWAVSLAPDAGTSDIANRTLTSDTQTISESSATAGWTLIGFTVKSDPTGAATCSTGEAYAGMSATVPADTSDYLVCSRSDVSGPSPSRQLRIQKVTGGTSHPLTSFAGSMTPGGTDASWAVSLPAGVQQSNVATRSVTTAGQTVTETTIPANWTLVGFTVKADPVGTATCAVGEAYSGSSAPVPADASNYLVCVRNDYSSSPATTRSVRVIQVTATATHPGGTFAGGIAPGGPDTGFSVVLGASQPASPSQSRTVGTGSHTVTETSLPADWSLVGYVVKPDGPSTSCSAGDAFGASATIPAGASPYLVCIRADYSTAPPATSAPMRMTVPRLTTTVNQDGLVDPDEWRDAAAVTGVINQFDGVAHPRQATFYIKYDSDFVYIAQRSTLLPNELSSDYQLPIWFEEGDNVVAFSLAPGSDPTLTPSHYQFRANVTGRRWHQEVRWENRGYKVVYPQNEGWNSAWTLANHLSPDQTIWESEYKIPLADLLQKKSSGPVGEWGLLLARDYPQWDQNAIVRSNDWRWGHSLVGPRHWGAAFFDNYRLESQYARATFAPDVPAIQVLSLGNLAAGQLVPDVHVMNTGPSLAQLTASIVVRNGATVVHQQSQDIDVAAFTRIPVPFGSQTFPAGGQYKLSIEVKRRGSGEILHQQDVPFRAEYATERGPQIPPLNLRGHHKEDDYLGVIQSVYNPIQNALYARVDLNLTPNRNFVTHGDIRIRRQGDTTPLVTLTMAPFNGDQISENKFTLPALTPGVYEATARVYDAGNSMLGFGRELFVRFDHAQLLPWLNNSIGVTNAVLPPYTPIQANGSLTQLDVIGRTYTVNGSGLFTGIQVNGQALLSGPSFLEIDVGGSPIPLSAPGTPTPIGSAPNRVSLRGQLNGPGWVVQNEAVLDYDGYMQFTLDLQPQQGSQTVNAIRLVVPLHDEWATHVHAMGANANHSVSSLALPSGNGRLWSTDRAYQRDPGLRHYLRVGNFKPYVWLGSVARGLAFMADNDQGWVPDETLATPAIEIRRTVRGVELVLNLVARPFTFNGPRRIVFSLQATPVRPMPPDFRARIKSTESTLTFVQIDPDDLAADGTTGLGYYTPGPAFPLDWGKNIQFRQVAETRGSVAVPFQISNGWINVMEVDDPQVPGLQGANIVGYLGPELTAQWSVGDAAMSKTDMEHRLFRYQRWIQETRVRGFYFDSGYPALGNNVEAAQGYRLDIPDRPYNGLIQPGYRVTGMREFFKRLRAVLVQENLDPFIVVHATDTMTVSSLAFADYMVDGENHFMGPSNSNTVFSEVWPPEQLQATGVSEKWGLGTFFIVSLNPERRFTGAKHSENILGYLMLHDYDAWEMHYFWPGYTVNGLDLSQPATFYGYWEARTKTGITSPRPDVFTTAWRQGNSLYVLAFNRSWDDLTAHPVTVNLANLGIAASQITAVTDIGNVGVKPPIGVSTGGTQTTVTMAIEPHLWRIIRIDF